MSGKFVRASKYRHVFGQAAKKELCYENLKVTKNAWDSNIIQCNGKYLSVTWEALGGGAFAVIPVGETGRLPDTVSLFRGHKGPVLDTAFDPFNPQQIASCSDDGQILLWEIPEDYSFRDYRDSDGNCMDITEPVKVLSGHTRKVGHIGWHPCAAGVLASASMDYTVRIWNVETGKTELTLQHTDLVTWFAFNYNGLLLATTSRDRKLRVWDLRTGKVVSEGASHTGAKASRVVWLGNTDRLCTTGFSRLSDRQVGIWDASDIGAGPIDGFMVVDSSLGVLIPVFDDANSILYLAGKGDGNIRYYEYENDVLHEISQYASTDAQRGFAAAPKTFVNMRENEVLKAYKTVNDHAIEPILFIVPRKLDLFQLDIYPDAPSDQPALTASEWFAGKDVNGPLLVPMEAIYAGTSPEVKESSPGVSISERKVELSKKASTAPSTKPSSPRKQPAAYEREQSPSSVRSAGPVDEVLKSSGKVENLLNKVVDESDDEDAKRVSESNDQDDEWEEVKKPETKKEEKDSEQKTPEPEAKPEPKISSEVEKKEPKNEMSEPPKALAEKDETKPESESVKKAETEIKPIAEPQLSENATTSQEKTEAQTKAEKTAEKTAASVQLEGSAKPATGAGQPTLRATVDKLASLVETLEKQVLTLTAANIERNDKIDALERKIDELLHK
ncbi:hypothetical protein HF325_006060 [Metschnikowia pulcherrima]|uniref:Coronin n=1 Tax=Metschnikowia pulcherrima TaxID=27326 RepID=A0A8H7L8V0_9ASCO|nr:hypothetical protein HF325_006060 [Metschnikowia pulcherrima]